MTVTVRSSAESALTGLPAKAILSEESRRLSSFVLLRKKYEMGENYV